MKVILLSNIEKLGTKGEVVNVKRGFARNYLVPRDMAVYATPQNMKKIGDIKAKAAEEEEKRLSELKKLADKISSINLVFVRKVDENDHMFGSVSETDIVNALAEQGVEVHKTAVQLEKHIKELGQNQVQIRLHKDITTLVRIDIRKEAQEEAIVTEPQALEQERPVEEVPAEEPVAEETPEQEEII